MANTSLKLTGLDFQEIKTNFKEYLKRQDSTFKDVDYEGSNINQLLDVLSYNTYINSFYLNMVASEMFLDSSILRDSVVSHVKELNYVPRSYRSAEANVTFTVTPSTSTSSLLIPKGTSFSSKVGSNSYTFSTNENIILTSNSSGVFNVNNLSIYEGRYITESFVYSANTDQRFVISNPTVDTRSISVAVLENNGANAYTYTRSTSFLGTSSNSQVFFIQAAENGQYELLFGDDIVSRKPQYGSTIVVDYRVNNGELPNGASTFYIDGPIQGHSNISSISTNRPASGGAINESIESIKFNAPRSFQNQDRAVTAIDYENILTANFPEINAASAYGGEDSTPPQYGKVFVAVDVTYGDGVSDADKVRFSNFLKTRCAIGLTPEVINPTFLYVEAKATVRYNTNVTTLSPSSVSTIVKNAISEFNSAELDSFKRTLRGSKLIEKINNSHPSILGVDLDLHPKFELNLIPSTAFNADVIFNFPLSTYVSFATTSEDYIRSNVKAIYSSRFTYSNISCTLQDDGQGNIGIYSTASNGVSTLIKTVGTVNYETGRVIINNLLVSAVENNILHLHANPATKDISVSRNQIIKIKEADTDVIIVPEAV